MKEFKINHYLTLKLEEEKTVIYVANKSFRQCKFLLLSIPIDDIELLEEIESIDEIAEKLDNSFEHEGDHNKMLPEVEFWGHCSNLQVWYENNYNTRLLHRDLAFPLLHELVKAGDPEASKSFTEEIARRIESGNPTVINYLVLEEYLNFLPESYLESLSYNDGFLENLMLNIVKKPHFKRKLLEFINFIRNDNSDKRWVNNLDLEDIFRVYEEIYNSHNTDELEIDFLDGVEFLLWNILKNQFKDLCYNLEPDTVVNLFKIYDNDDFYFINYNIVLNKHIITAIIDQCIGNKKEFKDIFESEFEKRLQDKKIYSIVNLLNNYIKFSDKERINLYIEDLIIKLFREPNLSEISNFIRFKVLRHFDIKELKRFFNRSDLGLMQKIHMVIKTQIDYENFNWSFNELKEYNYFEFKDWFYSILEKLERMKD